MLPFSKHRSRDALRAGLVAIRSRQRVSERRSPEQGENGSAGCWPQKIHPHTQLLQAQAKTQSTRKHPGCKQSRTDFAQSIGKKQHWSQQSAAAHSFSHRQTLGRWAKISAKIATAIAFPEIFRIFREMVPEIFGIFRENGGWLRFPDRFPEISGIFREIGPYKK